MDNISIQEFFTGIILIGGVLAVFVKYVIPWIQLTHRVKSLEKHSRENVKMIEENEQSNKLLCKAMIALIDNRLTNNNIDGLKTVKSELMNYITQGNTHRT